MIETVKETMENLTKEQQEELLEKYFKEKLEEQYRRGLQTGIIAVSQVALDKLNDTSKSLIDRVVDVKHFLETPLKRKQTKTKDVLPAEDKFNEI